SFTEKLVDLGRGIGFDNLPAEVVREAGRRLLDALGCMIAGAHGETTVAVRRVALGLGGVAESSILGTRERTSCERAALVNGTALRFLDFMDGHPGPYPCHPCFNIPPLLALAERVHASGKQLATAIVTGYEIMPRFQENSGLPDFGARGWAGSTNLSFSIPIAAAGLLNLNREQSLSALGMAVTHGNVLDATSHGQIPMNKSILDGMTAANAIVAALLAEQGISGPREVLEGSGGFAQAVAGSINYDGLVAPIKRYKISESYTKLYNTVKCGQTAVAAAYKLVRDNKLDWREIASIRIGFAQRDAKTQSRESYARPQSRDTGNHSVRFCIAAALVDGQLTADQFEPEKLRSPDILSLVDKSVVYADETLDVHWPAANPTTIIMRTSAGQELTETMVFPPGHPNNVLPDDMLEQKFRQLTGKILSGDQISKVIEMTHRLEELANVRELTDVLRPRS
ncbi:MAG TPA: MmgE/PrpD family protein, partial [Candidatus Limnocylindrales bacterium]|nr:MmgE/PrpD family protein [Candidatus Limnocylindrales bacterium]